MNNTNETNEVVERIFTRLKDNFPDFLPEDYDGIKKDLAELLEEGYSESQAYRFTKNREEVDPHLEEELALKRMKIVDDEVPDTKKKRRPKRI
jgi:hypothetical protein